jgi:hypothetical protein
MKITSVTVSARIHKKRKPEGRKEGKKKSQRKKKRETSTRSN